MRWDTWIKKKFGKPKSENRGFRPTCPKCGQAKPCLPSMGSLQMFNKYGCSDCRRKYNGKTMD